MALTNPVNLYGELSSVCACTPDVGGTWSLTSAPAVPTFSLCVNKNGAGFSNESITALPHNMGGGSEEDIVIDFTGASCGGSNANDGVYVFVYTVGEGACQSSATVTVTLIDNEVSINRYDEACVYHLDIVNPSTPTNISKKIATYNKVAPDIFLTNEWITPRLSYQARVTRTDLENCIGPNSVTMYTSNATVGESHTAYTADKPAGVSSVGVDGPYVTQSFQIDGLSFSAGGYIKTIKLYIGGSPVTVDLSSIPYTTTISQFAIDLQAGIVTAMNAVTGSNTFYDCTVGLAGGTNIKFTYMCAHNVTGWCGINKADTEVKVCLSGGCTGDTCGVSGITCLYPSVTQSATGKFQRSTGVLYTTPCGDDLSIFFELCPNRQADIEFFDLSGCDYNTLALVNANGRGYYTNAGEGTNTQYKICQTQSLSADSSSTSCSGATYSWSPSGSGDTIVADSNVAYTVTADCQGCLDTSPEYCFPTADDIDANVVICKDTPNNNVTGVAMAVVNSNCSAGTIDYASVQFLDVDNFITPTYSGPSSVDLAIPADEMPSFYYMVYQVPDSLGRKSNFAIFSVRLFRSSQCCDTLL